VTITVVQAKTGTGTGKTVTFNSDVTAGNSVVLAGMFFSASNVTISSSAPLFGGSAVTGAVKLADIQSPFLSGQTDYDFLWLLPDLPGGSAVVSITVTNGTAGANTGLVGWEVAGLGASPSLDKKSTGAAPAGGSTAAASGSTGAITSAPEFIAACMGTQNQFTAAPGSPWTVTAVGDGSFAQAGYQIAASSGGAYNFTGTVTSGMWAAAVAAVAATAVPAVHADAPAGDYDRPLRLTRKPFPW